MIGEPIRHSLSPVVHNAAFRSLELDWVYVAFEVTQGDVAAALIGARALRVEGLSVTMPHKEAVARLVDQLSPTAERLGAANAVVRRDRSLMADSTDGAGFLDALRLDHGFDPAGARCMVFGAGGTARAVVFALAGAGAREVIVVGRTPDRVQAAALLAGPAGRMGKPEQAADAELLVNATPLGMAGSSPGPPVDPSLIGPGHVVFDAVYHPAVTPFLAEARRRGATTIGGLGMLVHQAAHAFRLWTGQEPPLEVMSAAALGFLGGSSGLPPERSG